MVNVDKATMSLSIGLAVDLFKAGKEILDLLEEGKELDEFELLEVIEKHNAAKDAARGRLIDSIRERREAST